MAVGEKRRGERGGERIREERRGEGGGERVGSGWVG